MPVQRRWAHRNSTSKAVELDTSYRIPVGNTSRAAPLVLSSPANAVVDEPAFTRLSLCRATAGTLL